MVLLKRTWYTLIWFGLTLSTGFITVCAAVYLYLAPDIPPVEVLRNVELRIPLRVYANDGQLISEIGEQRRTPLTFEEIPELYVKALLAIEDHRFEQHFGVDPLRFASAAVGYVLYGPGGAGGSTITQQVARSFFLNPDKTFTRKFTEIIVAFRMEQLLTKEEIFELYSNKMFLGHRAYGIQAAAQVYYGRDIHELTLAELATIAGLHQRPSAANPLSFPERAMTRRNTVLGRMHDLGFISDNEYETAISAPNTAQQNSQRIAVNAPYVAEEARLQIEELFGEDAIDKGFKVITTVNVREQAAANAALVRHLTNYTERHGYIGPETRYELSDETVQNWDTEEFQRLVSQHGYFGNLEPALVVEVVDGTAAETTEGEEDVSEQAPHVVAWGRFTGRLEIPLEEMTWARERRRIDDYGPSVERPSDVLARGDLIRVRETGDGQWRLTQIPVAQAAFVALDPDNGAIRAMVGGFDYFLSSFNRAMQAERQPGSNFKPFVYTAAIDQGFSPSTLINDAPIALQDDTLEDVWRPRNSGDRYLGYIPMREALYRSINVASVRLLERIGVNYAADYVSRFGLNDEDIQRNLGMVLGNSVFTPLEIARGYAVFANGGYLVDPFLIDRIEDANGNIVYESPRVRVCENCPENVGNRAPRVLSPQTHYLMTHILRDSVARGTATGAQVLGRQDLAGKTGTTNDGTDAWFTGFSPHRVASAWVGRDDNTTLGFNEFGGRAALPIWIDYMQVALEGMPEQVWPQPAGITQARIDPDTGKLAPAGHENAIFEVFHADRVPTEFVDGASGNSGGSGQAAAGGGSGTGGPLF